MPSRRAASETLPPQSASTRLMCSHSTRASDGTRLWDIEAKYKSRPILNEEALYAEPGKWDLLTGQPLPFKFSRSYGCGILAGPGHVERLDRELDERAQAFDILARGFAQHLDVYGVASESKLSQSFFNCILLFLRFSINSVLELKGDLSPLSSKSTSISPLFQAADLPQKN